MEKVESIIVNELTYYEEDNLIYRLLQRQLHFHQYLLKKALNGETSDLDSLSLKKEVTLLENIVNLYKEV